LANLESINIVPFSIGGGFVRHLSDAALHLRTAEKMTDDHGWKNNGFVQRRALSLCARGGAPILRGKFVWLGWVLLLASLACLPACRKTPSEPLVIADFESDAELDRFDWKCHTLFSLSSEHVTQGKQSLRLELYPSEYPGLAPRLKQKDWRDYRALCLDVYHPGKEPLRLAVRIDDRPDSPDYPDRYNQSLLLQPGENRLSLPLESLVTSGTRRKLNLATIHSLLFFLVDPPQKAVLYIDHLRLEPFGIR
jgi:hypothetical protein